MHAGPNYLSTSLTGRIDVEADISEVDIPVHSEVSGGAIAYRFKGL